MLKIRGSSGLLAVLSLAVLFGAASPPRGPAADSRPAPASHLLGQTSPYLLEHLDNPIDWYPWGEEAIGRARGEQKPIFLSIGYSACHWCHVMEREVFSDPEVARVLNGSFIAVTVDREERPDLDDLYMTAVLAMTGSGGWPMSVFLTPDLKPFYGGSYVPKERFLATLRSIDDAWSHRRDEVLASAEKVRAAVEEAERAPKPEEGPARGDDLLGPAVAALKATFDRTHGGFGGAPRFPPHGALWLLLEAGWVRGDAVALDEAVRTLDAMARGGLYDQLGGGFFRYATDESWLVPHFEKMLYDNALLVPLYLDAWKRTGRDDFRRVAEETLAWVTRDMTDAQGGFYSSMDADSEGEEGKYYLWTAGQVKQAAGAKDGDLAIAYFGLADPGRFEGGRSLPHVLEPIEAFAAERGLTPADARGRLDAARGALFQARSRRVPPRHDEKVLTAWNGLMISAFARAYGATGDERYRASAGKAARFLLARVAGPGGDPRVSWTRGRIGPPGTLDDSAFLARGLLDLYDVTSDRTFLEAASLVVRGAAKFSDPDGGGWFFTAADRRDLILRSKRLEDQALPSGNAIMVECLARLAGAVGDRTLLVPATRTLDLALPALRRSPLAAPYMILAAERLRGGRDSTPSPRAAAPGSLLGTPVFAATPSSVAHGEGDRIIHGTIVSRPNPQPAVESSIAVPGGTVRPGQAVTFSLRLDIQPGWHINSSRPTLEYLIPTKIEFPDPAAATVQEVAYPDGAMVNLKFAQEKLSVYQGTATIRATISPPPDSAPGPRPVRALLTYQACSDQACLAPERIEFEIPLVIEGAPVADAAARPTGSTGGAFPGSSRSGQGPAAFLASNGKGGEGIKALLEERGLVVLLGVVFLAGLALNLTPCVYPVMPVTIGFFANQAAGSWGRRVGLPALYVLGMAVTYSVLGMVAGLTGGLFGATLQSRWVTGALVLIFVVMALSMFGLFEIRMPAWLTRFSGGRRGVAGAFLMGLTMGVAAAPCIGPFIVPLLAFVGASGKPLLGFWLFFVMAVGMGVPNLVLGIFSGALAGLPRSGTWLIYAKKVMGVALLAVALYFLQPFLTDRRMGWIALLFALVSGIYLALLDRTRIAGGWSRLLKIVVGLLVAVFGAWVALPMVSARPEVSWRPYAAETIERARAGGRPVIVDFFADWCLPCKELDRSTFADPRVIEEADRFVLLKADLTSFESGPVRDLRARFEVVGVPTVVFIDGRGVERKDLRVYGFEDSGAFLARMRQVR